MFDNGWMGKWQKAVNDNGPMSWIGKHFTADFLFGFGDSEYQVSFKQGKIDSYTNEMTPKPATHWL